MREMAGSGPQGSPCAAPLGAGGSPRGERLSAEPQARTAATPRVLGRRGPQGARPLLIAVAGIHGNEPAGVLAVRRFLAALDASGTRLDGRFVALAGNRAALAMGRRFVDRDLNRIWLPPLVERLRATRRPECSEERELLELLDEIEAEIDSRPQGTHFLDLHTSSAEGAPFVTVGDTLRNRSFARAFPLPAILGLEEQIDGALLEYMNNLGCITLGIEAGQHADPAAVEVHEACLWTASAAAGLLPAPEPPEVRRARQRLAACRRGRPRTLEVVYRHRVRPEDGFRMRPGFASFTPVVRGQAVADDLRGPVRAPVSGLVLLPLYQGQGSDGFFIARPVSGFWLGLSRLLRRLRAGEAAHWLPGVRRHPERDDTLVVDVRIARWFPLQIFHLLGYRKLRRSGSLLLVTRRRFDLPAAPGERG
ncbi:MAG: aspartoacylase [Acidobacteria bacterium]|nr:MAG: aspartoacylase [Acidobacteriota bacterium]